MTHYQALTNCLKYLNSLDSKIEIPLSAAHILFRIRYVNNGINIESFMAMADGQSIIAKEDVKSDCFWVAPRSIALDDVGKNEDANELVRLHMPTRSMRYEQFFIHENSPILSIRVPMDLVHQFESTDVGFVVLDQCKNQPAVLPCKTENQVGIPAKSQTIKSHEANALLDKFGI